MRSRGSLQMRLKVNRHIAEQFDDKTMVRELLSKVRRKLCLEVLKKVNAQIISQVTDQTRAEVSEQVRGWTYVQISTNWTGVRARVWVHIQALAREQMEGPR